MQLFAFAEKRSPILCVLIAGLAQSLSAEATRYTFTYDFSSGLEPVVSRSAPFDLITPDTNLPETQPWALEELSAPPSFTWLSQSGPVHSLFYKGLVYKGYLTDVFAYYASPSTLGIEDTFPPPYPGIVLLHGGGGTAFPDWAEMWAQRGYAAIAMDLAGSRPIEGLDPYLRENREKLPHGGPSDASANKFEAIALDQSNHWCYHAPANAILAHSLIRAFDEVDQTRTGITGISWGGYLTCIVSGLDNRFNAAVPVYGCGFLDSHTVFENSLDQLSPHLRELWLQLYDPGRYLPAVRSPIFFLNGTNDFAYWLSSWKKSVEAVPSDTEKRLRLQINMAHNQTAGTAPEEIERFFDSQLRSGQPLLEIEQITLLPDMLAGRVSGNTSLASAVLVYSTDAGPETARTWQELVLAVDGSNFSGPLPPETATIWFVNITDSQGQTVSSVPMP